MTAAMSPSPANSVVVPSGVPAGPDTARVLHSLFLGHRGVVDVNASSWRPEARSGEFAWHNSRDGGLFTLALEHVLKGGRSDQLDSNRDGIVTWSELEASVATVSRSFYDRYKAGFFGGELLIDPVNLQRLQGQATQTPQFFSHGEAMLDPPQRARDGRPAVPVFVVDQARPDPDRAAVELGRIPVVGTTPAPSDRVAEALRGLIPVPLVTDKPPTINGIPIVGTGFQPAPPVTQNSLTINGIPIIGTDTRSVPPVTENVPTINGIPIIGIGPQSPSGGSRP